MASKAIAADFLKETFFGATKKGKPNTHKACLDQLEDLRGWILVPKFAVRRDLEASLVWGWLHSYWDLEPNFFLTPNFLTKNTPSKSRKAYLSVSLFQQKRLVVKWVLYISTSEQLPHTNFAGWNLVSCKIVEMAVTLSLPFALCNALTVTPNVYEMSNEMSDISHVIIFTFLSRYAIN